MDPQESYFSEIGGAVSDSLLEISTSRSNHETIIKLSGECDISNVDDVNEAVFGVLTGNTRQIVFDVEELSFMGSCGLASIEQAIEGLQLTGGVVVIRKPSRIVRWLLDFFGIANMAVVID